MSVLSPPKTLRIPSIALSGLREGTGDSQHSSRRSHLMQMSHSPSPYRCAHSTPNLVVVVSSPASTSLPGFLSVKMLYRRHHHKYIPKSLIVLCLDPTNLRAEYCFPLSIIPWVRQAVLSSINLEELPGSVRRFVLTITPRP